MGGAVDGSTNLDFDPQRFGLLIPL